MASARNLMSLVSPPNEQTSRNCPPLFVCSCGLVEAWAEVMLLAGFLEVMLPTGFLEVVLLAGFLEVVLLAGFLEVVLLAGFLDVVLLASFFFGSDPIYPTWSSVFLIS
jgi:hypothetical protein